MITLDVELVPSQGVELEAQLDVPEHATSVVVFAHGWSGDRTSPRNRLVASALREAGIATVLVELLTREEGLEDAHCLERRFDVDLLAERLVGVVDWLDREPATAGLDVGLHGVSTGAAAALGAAALRPELIRAVVARAGRPDLAGDRLARVTTPTLLVVGALDEGLREVNLAAARRLAGPSQVVSVAGAGHLFEEPGTLQRAAALAREWFVRHLAVGGP